MTISQFEERLGIRQITKEGLKTYKISIPKTVADKCNLKPFDWVKIIPQGKDILLKRVDVNKLLRDV